MSTPNSQITVLSWEVCTIHNPHILQTSSRYITYHANKECSSV